MRSKSLDLWSLRFAIIGFIIFVIGMVYSLIYVVIFGSTLQVFFILYSFYTQIKYNEIVPDYTWREALGIKNEL